MVIFLICLGSFIFLLGLINVINSVTTNVYYPGYLISYLILIFVGIGLIVLGGVKQIKKNKKRAIGENANQNKQEPADDLTDNENTQCWFCKGVNGKADLNRALWEPMYRIISRERSGNEIRIRYEQCTIKIPRCKICANRHNWRTFWRVLILFIAIPLGLPFGYFAQEILNVGKTFAVIIGIAGIGLCMAIGFVILNRIFSKSSTKGASHGLDHPTYKQLKDLGWQDGYKPAGGI